MPVAVSAAPRRRRCRSAIRCSDPAVRLGSDDVVVVKNEMTTLSGGSLGSCVDEERSQLRELM
jgi:hypothetical protein